MKLASVGVGAGLPPLDDLDEPTAPVPLLQMDAAAEPVSVAISSESPAPLRSVPPAVLPVPARARLEDIWPDSTPRRRLPNKLRLALAAAGLLLLVILVLGHRGRSSSVGAQAALSDEMVVSAEDLKNRREVRPEDFRGKRAAAMPPAVSAQGLAGPDAGPVGPDSLAARRARRGADPEDVLTLKRAGRQGGGVSAAQDTGPLFQGPVYIRAGAPEAPGGSDGAGPKGERMAAAGAAVPATLQTPIELQTGAATVVVKVERSAGALAGSRCLGSASLAANRLVIRFTKVILADGHEARIDAEAQDADGAFGLALGRDGSAEGGSIVGDVAKDTATDVLTGALGVGLPGRMVDNYRRRSSGSRSPWERRAVSLPAGTPLQVFFREAVELGP